MTVGHFVWTDLSTYDVNQACSDYKTIFNWQFTKGESYHIALSGGDERAGVFLMPERLAKIEMPSFWMSYIHVSDVDETVAIARNFEGVIIEVEPQAFNKDARIALIRDPSGAGFSIYEGPEIQTAAEESEYIKRYHHAQNIAPLIPFYQALFDWEFKPVLGSKHPAFDVFHKDGTQIAQFEQPLEKIRGKYNYWMPSFLTGSLTKRTEALKKLGGQQVARLDENRLMLRDTQGAYFMLEEKQSDESEPHKSPNFQTPLLPIFGLICVWLAVLFEVNIFWAILFLSWLWPAIKTRQINLFGTVERSTNPLLYWIIVGTWGVLSCWLLLHELQKIWMIGF